MALYLVVRHRLAQPQSFENVWQNESDVLLMSIKTTPEVGVFCRAAHMLQQRVYVHRCGYRDLGIRPTICCSVHVAEVRMTDGETEVQFQDQLPLAETPVVQPSPGQNSYEAPPP